MKTILSAAAAAFLCGCMNLYVRCPATDLEIRDVYQSTRTMACASIIASFPTMYNGRGDGTFHWWNAFTIVGLGVPCAADAACEAAVDTIFLPFDWPVSSARAGKGSK